MSKVTHATGVVDTKTYLTISKKKNRVVTPVRPGPIKQRYCGPGAISILTGKTAEDAAAEINRLRGIPETNLVKGTHTHEAVEVLRALGQRVELLRFEPVPMSLKKWMATRVRPGVRYLLNITNHYCVVVDGLVGDNITEVLVPLDRYPFKNKRIETVWSVEARS